MAQLVIDFADALLPRIRDAICAVYGYQANIPDPGNPGSTIPNPQTKVQFAKAQVARFVKEVVKGYEATQAGEVARKAAAEAADAQVIVS